MELPMSVLLSPSPSPPHPLTLYPGGGKSVTTNRTNWPISGGALSIIPGWNAGHPTSFFYINMGFGSEPPNMTNVINPVFQITGPSRDPFPGQFCFRDLPLPKNASVKVGDNATIQVIQVALHGASLYNVSSPPSVSFEKATRLLTLKPIVCGHHLCRRRPGGSNARGNVHQLVNHRVQPRLLNIRRLENSHAGGARHNRTDLGSDGACGRVDVN